MITKQPNISIVIPTKNAENTISQCIKGIMQQTLFDQVEIIIIDTGSTDRTLHLINALPIRLYQINPNDFNHGDTRNYGITLAKGKYVVMTVQDAIPHNDKWLENMYRHFSDSDVVGVCGKQIVPHQKGYNPHEWFRPQTQPLIKKLVYNSKAEFQNLSSKEKRRICSWDDVTAMYKKSFMMENPFDELMFGEDMQWAKKTLLLGKKIVYDENAKVEHYHHANREYTYKRVFIESYYSYQFFKFIPPIKKDNLHLIKLVYRNIRWNVHPKWILFNYNVIKTRNKAIKDFKKYLKNGTLEQQLYSICKIILQGISQKI